MVLSAEARSGRLAVLSTPAERANFFDINRPDLETDRPTMGRLHDYRSVRISAVTISTDMRQFPGGLPMPFGETLGGRSSR
jgi:hypothetical protein